MNQQPTTRQALRELFQAVEADLTMFNIPRTARVLESLATAKAALAQPEPLVEIRKKSTPCGECHLQPGERCDICGARDTQPEPQGEMLNGLTEAQTSATASVAGLGSEPLTDEALLSLARDAGLTLTSTPNRLYTVRGQTAQLLNFARAARKA